MSVVLDVITIAKNKRYLVLDPVSQEAQEYKPINALMAKKRVNSCFPPSSVLNVSSFSPGSSIGRSRSEPVGRTAEFGAFRTNQIGRLSRRVDEHAQEMATQKSRQQHSGRSELSKR